MKIILKITLFMALLLGANILHAQLNLNSNDLATIESTTPLSMDEMPTMGNFYSAANPSFPPSPGNILGLSGWNLGGGFYLLDDLDGSGGGFHADDVTPPPPFGGGGSAPTNNYPPFRYPTNGLWLSITNVANNTVYANLHGGTDTVYEVYSKTDLTVPNWGIETEVFPGANTNTMPFNIPMAARTNLFLWARDWTSVTSLGNITPEWWFYEWFGTTNMSDYDRDYVGNTLAYDYAYHQEPDIIAFALQFTNTYVSTRNVPARLTIFGGIPSYVATLINDTNLNDAVWEPYEGTNVTVSLGSSNDTYAVSMGLRGFSPNATVTWVPQQLLSLNAPTPILTITSPTGTVSQPMIQVQGMVNETLSNLTYDVSNSAGMISGQQGYWSAAFFDTNVQNFTTNTFQCFDVPVTNGLNTITLHATDLLGTSVTTNVSFTVDYSSQANPPALGVLWPQDGTPIAGNSFTLEAQMDDDTATVTAQITDNNGNTITLPALVERSGTVWVNNLPLAAGTNTLTITAINAAGHSMTTNLTLVQSTVAVTMDPLGSGQLNQPTVTATGTVSDPSESVTVNGQSASVDDEGNWEANTVSVSPTGIAIFDVELSGGSSGSGSYHFLQSQPPVVGLMSYAGYGQRSGSTIPGNCQNSGLAEVINWIYSSGGSDTEIGWGVDDCYPANSFNQFIFSGGYNGYGPSWEMVNASGVDASSSGGSFSEDNWSSNVTTSVGIYSSGQTPIGQKALFLVGAQVFDEDTGAQLPGSSLRFTHQVPDTSVIDVTNDDSSVWSQFLAIGPGGTNFEVTPYANGRNIKFNQSLWQVTNVTLQIIDNNTGTNLSAQSNAAIVGQQMNLGCQLNVMNALLTNSMLSNFQWTIPGYAISNYMVASDASTTTLETNFPTTNSSVAFYWVDGANNRTLQCSATIDGATITGQTVFNVVSPIARIISQTSEVALGRNIAGTFFGICFGTNGGNPGIIFSNYIIMPSGNYNYGNLGYTSQWVQVVEPFSLASDSFQQGTNIVTYTQINTNVVLDNLYPYPFNSYPQTDDSPCLQTDATNEIAATNIQYSKMWLMFQPMNGRWVPLRAVTWNCSGSATNSGTNWILIDRNWTTNPPDADPMGAFPEWNGNLANVPVTSN